MQTSSGQMVQGKAENSKSNQKRQRVPQQQERGQEQSGSAVTLAGRSLQRLFLLQLIKTTQKQSSEHGATPVLRPCLEGALCPSHGKHEQDPSPPD